VLTRGTLLAEKPLKTSYDEAASDFEAHASQSPWNAYADRPTMLSLLPDVDGRDVLDAGCGTGLYCGELLDRGSRLWAFDPSAGMVELAKAKHGDRARFAVHALESMSDHYEAESFDVVLSALVLDHVEDLEVAYAQIDRVLRPGGHFVCS
jgi:SAM-dependent methyltransferase